MDDDQPEPSPEPDQAAVDALRRVGRATRRCRDVHVTARLAEPAGEVDAWECRLIRTWTAAAMLLVFIAPAQASEHSLWWRTKAEAACISDVIRLCRSAMPDEDKVTACMESKKAQVSASCASYYPGGENAD